MLTIPTRVPAPVSVLTVRPPTSERVIAMQWIGVAGTAVLRATIAVVAEQAPVVNGSSTVSMPAWSGNTVGVTCSAALVVTYTTAAASAGSVTGAAVLAVTYKRTATQSTTTVGAAARAVRYTLAATEAITTTSTSEVRAAIDCDATNDISTISNATTQVDGGTSVVGATQAIEVAGSATLAETRLVAATNSVTVTGNAAITGVLITRTAASTTTVAGSAVLRAIYTRAATQAITSTETGTTNPGITATQTIAVTETAAARAAYTRGATSGADTTSTAAINAVTNIYRSEFNDLTGWTNYAGTWTVSGGLLRAPNDNNGHVGRMLSTPLTTVTVEASITAAPSTAYGGIGVILYLDSSPNLYNAHAMYSTVDYWGVRDTYNDAVVGNATQTLPMRSKIVVAPGSVKFYVNDVLRYTKNVATTTVYGIGIYQNGGNSANRVDWIEAR